MYIGTVGRYVCKHGKLMNYGTCLHTTYVTKGCLICTVKFICIIKLVIYNKWAYLSLVKACLTLLLDIRSSP